MVRRRRWRGRGGVACGCTYYYYFFLFSLAAHTVSVAPAPPLAPDADDDDYAAALLARTDSYAGFIKTDIGIKCMNRYVCETSVKEWGGWSAG